MARLFGTDGVRGVANSELTPEMSFRLGRAYGYLLAKKGPHPRILLGKDTRISGDLLEGAFCGGACSVGCDILRVGVLPTPGVAYLTRKLAAQGGVMISASHNPIEDNGIKIFSHEGFKLPDEMEEQIEEIVLAHEDHLPRPVGEEVGRVIERVDACHLYVEFVKSLLDCSLEGIRLVIDCAHGAAWDVAPRIFKDLGAEVLVLNNQPNGVNINVNCGSTNPGLLQKVVVADRAHVGIAFDGDADRCLAVDEKGHVLNGDQMLTLFAGSMKEEGKLTGSAIVATVMSNLGLEHALNDEDIGLFRTKVGDRHVLEEMRARGLVLGGEQSGHIIFLEHNTTGDGLITATTLARILKRKMRPLSDLASRMRQMPQLLVNVRAKHKDRLDENEEICRAIAETEQLLLNRGRLLVRASGTEPLVRVMAEGPDEGELNEIVGRIAHLIEERLG
jgi:phosphoglucosamine mutase